MSINRLYEQMLVAASREGGEMSAEMQQRIFDYGQKCKRWDLLGFLARHPLLDPAIDQQLGTIDDLTVVVAWSTRPGRRTEDLVARLQSDKRVTAVIELAKQPGLDPVVYETLAKIKSSKMAPILAGNPSVPGHIRVRKLAEFVARPPRGRHQRHEAVIHEICKDADEDLTRRLYEAVATHATTIPYVIACLERPYTTRADIGRWIDQLERLNGADGSEWQHRAGDLVRLLGATADAEQRRQLIDNAAQIVGKANHNWYVSSLRTALTELQSLDQESLDLLAALEKATDTGSFDELYEKAKGHIARDHRHRLVGAVVRNPHATKEAVLAELLHARSNSDMRTYVRDIESRGWYDVLTELIAPDKHGRYTPSIVHALSDRKTFLRRYVKEQADAGELPDWVTTTEVFFDDPEIALTSLRWRRLTETLGDFPQVASLVEKELLDVLGDNPGRWEALISIGDSFEGTFQDLLVVARELS